MRSSAGSDSTVRAVQKTAQAQTPSPSRKLSSHRTTILVVPQIYEYYCDGETCEFSVPDGWGYYMYAIADDGERVHCPHPGGTRRAREVVGSDASEDELDERTGFTYH